MVFMEQTYKCSGCGKEKKGFGYGPLPIRLGDYSKIQDSIVEEYVFCNLKCLNKWSNITTRGVNCEA